MLIEKIAANVSKLSDDKFLKIIARESKIPVVGFHNIPILAKRYKFKMIKQAKIIKKIKGKKYKVAETHFAQNSLRSDHIICQDQGDAEELDLDLMLLTSSRQE